MRKFINSVAVSALALGLASCGGGGTNNLVSVAPPPPPPTQTAQTFNAERCFTQLFGSQTVRDVLVPDVVTINLAQPSTYPNGRLPQDPVIDTLISVLFLDQTRHTPRTLVNIPLDPPGVVRPISTTFPFLAPPYGSPPLSPTNGVNFNFRTEAASTFTLVERMGLPAVATVLINSPRKIAYNEGTPAMDSAGVFTADMTAGLTTVANQINDDLQRLGLTPCSLQ